MTMKVCVTGMMALWVLMVGMALAGCGGSDAPAADDPDADPDKDGLSNALEEQIGTDPANPDSDGDGLTDGAELAQGEDPRPAEVKAADPAPAPPVPKKEAAPAADAWQNLHVGTVTDDSEDRASSKLEALCTNNFTATFTFQADDDNDEWKVWLKDADDDSITYVNLDDSETIEVDSAANDTALATPARPHESHRVSIRYVKPTVSVSVNGKKAVHGFTVDNYLECVHLKVDADDGMTLSKFNVRYR